AAEEAHVARPADHEDLGRRRATGPDQEDGGRGPRLDRHDGECSTRARALRRAVLELRSEGRFPANALPEWGGARSNMDKRPLASGQAQELGGVPPQDPRAVGRAEPELLDDAAWPRVAHVEAAVAAEHHPVGSHRLDEIPERARRVRDRVVREPPEVAGDLA